MSVEDQNALPTKTIRVQAIRIATETSPVVHHAQCSAPGGHGTLDEVVASALCEPLHGDADDSTVCRVASLCAAREVRL